jgi:hypothetical protein
MKLHLLRFKDCSKCTRSSTLKQILNCNLKCCFLRIRFKGSHLNDDVGDFQREASLNHSLDGTDGKGSDSYNYSSEIAN